MHRARLLTTAIGGAVLALTAALTLGPVASASPTSTDRTTELRTESTATSDPITAGPRALTVGSAECPSKTVVVGGGVQVSAGSLRVSLNGSIALSDHEWGAYVNNASASSATFRVYAICVSRPSRYRIVEVTAGNPARTSTKVAAACPRSTVVLGGGGAGSTSSLKQNLGSSYAPDTASWQVTVIGTTSDSEATAQAICARAPRPTLVENSALSIGPRSTGGPAVACPIGQRPLSGGVEITTTSPLVTLQSTLPVATTRNGWYAAVNNRSTSPVDVIGHVICA